MKTSSLLLCLTLLIIPAVSAKIRNCMVVSITGDTVVLQCAGTGAIQTNDRVRLHISGKE
jgi:hypothetical protein